MTKHLWVVPVVALASLGSFLLTVTVVELVYSLFRRKD